MPDPALRPHGFAIATGDLLDLEETARAARGDGLRARRPGRGPRPVRDPRRDPRRLPGDGRPRRARRPVRHRGRVAARVLDLHPALLRRRRARRDRARRPSWRPSTASWPRWPRPRRTRPDIAELLPVDRFRAFLDLAPADAARPRRRRGGRRARARATTGRTSAPPSTTTTPTTSTSSPTTSLAALDDAGAGPAERDLGRPAVRVPRADRRHRRAQSLKEAESELEKLVRSGYRTVVTWSTAARASAPPTTSTGSSASLERRRRDPLKFTQAHAARRLHRPGLQARGPARPPAAAPPPRRAHGRHGRRAQARGALALVRRPAHRRHRRPRGPRPRALRRLRHEDRRRRHARLPRPRVRRHGQGLHAGRPAREDQPLRRRGRQRTRRCRSSAARAGRR